MVNSSEEKKLSELASFFLSNSQELEPKRRVCLFFSYDIVNSSAYKTINYFGWSSIIIAILKEIQKRVEKKIFDVQLWKVLGDEAIFIVPLKRKNDIFQYIDDIFSILNNTISDMKLGNFNHSNAYNDENELMKLLNVLSLKAAAWMAIVAEGIDRTAEYDNIYTKYDIGMGYKVKEYFGNDIDTGFRISKKATERRLFISFEIAYFLAEKRKFLSRLFIITYEKLKGVWKFRPYPIICYHNKTSSKVTFKESFYYDEMIETPLAKAYFENRSDSSPLGYPKKMFTDNKYALKKLVKDIQLEQKIQQIRKLIPQNDNWDRLIDEDETGLEFHCAAVCYDEKAEKILVFKRSSHKEYLGGLWEFGCARASPSLNLVDSIKKSYERDFGISISPIVDESRQDIEPVPIAVYQLNKSNGLHKGIICLAKIVKTENFHITEKYEATRWISENEVEGLEINGIPDFKQTLLRAFKLIKELKMNKKIEDIRLNY